jgi:hypothetical protein
MIKLQKNEYLLLQRIFSSIIFSLYLLYIFYLYLNTDIKSIDTIEALKLIGPISIMLVFTSLNRGFQTLFLYFLILILYAHIFIALIYLVSNFNVVITPDNRLVIPILGRSPGATAQIFCVAIVINEFFLKDRIIGLNKALILFNFMSIVIILCTQARTFILLLLIFFLLSYSRIWINYIRFLKLNLHSVFLFILIFSLFSAVYISGIADEIIQRSVGSSFYSGRDALWFSFINEFFSRNEWHQIFGTDLSRNLVIATEISYETSDVHNTILDIMNYYGLLPLLIIIIWYIFSSGFWRSKKSFTILLAYFPVLMLSSVFKFPLAFYSSLLFLLLPIYFSNNFKSLY